MNKEKSTGNTVVVIDGGGRGAALVDKYAQSEHVERVLAIPGNKLMGINTDKSVIIYPELKTTSVSEIAGICEKEQVNLADISQDNAVEAALADALREIGIPTIGPTRKAGQIEWDKVWSREFGQRNDLPQPSFKVCLSQQEGIDYVKSQPDQPWFIKASGLAEGKGALPAKNNEEALEKIKEMERFKEAGKIFLVEKWLKSDDGSGDEEEFSTFAFSDGKNFKIIGSAQDHKRVNNFDEGENTGGMGCSTPPLILTPELMHGVEEIFDKTIKGLCAENRPYNGILFLGGMVIRKKGNLLPYVVEFNARWGDPEVQVILPGLINDLFEVSMSVANGDISNLKLQMDGKSRVVVAGASKGYPGDYKDVKGKQIHGLDDARKINGVKLYGGGIKEKDGKYFASGGRLFYLVGEGKTVIEARQKAYEAMSLVYIDGNNLHFRTDIGYRDVQRLNAYQNK